MIDKTALTQFVERQLEGTEIFLVDIEVSANNEIKVEVDSPDSLDIDFCIDLTRKIEAEFDRDKEDYELEVGSAGLTSPFKVPAQYRKNIGNPVEVLTVDGRKLKGILTDADNDGCEVEIEEKVKHEGAKRPVIETSHIRLSYPEIKQAVYLLPF